MRVPVSVRVLRPAIVHDHLIQDGGAERVLRALMRMWPGAPVYTLAYDEESMGNDFRGHDIRVSGYGRLPGVTRWYQALLPLMDGAFRRFDLSEYDLVVSDASGWAKSVVTRPDALHVCYCHTPTRYLWSDAGRYLDEEVTYPRPVKAGIRAFTPLLRRRDVRAAAGVDRFVANSRHVADRIRRYYDRDSTVIHPPVDLARFSPGEPRGEHYLVISRLRTYKRVDLAIEACNALRAPLKVIGTGADEPRLRALAGPTVEFLGRVDDHRLASLLGSARGFLHPQEEDFGIAMVEALAAGTPVIAYGVGGASEVIEDGVTGTLFRKQTVDGMAGAIQRARSLTFDPAVLTARASGFSEERFAAEMTSLIEAAYD